MKVVNVRSHTCTHYIGRGSAPGIAINAQLGNPFSHFTGTLAQFKVATREEAIARYEEWARKTPGVREKIKQLPRNAVLGCWCKPLACHGDVIVKLWEEQNA